MRSLWVALAVVLSSGVCLLVARLLYKVSNPITAPLLGPNSEETTATLISGISTHTGQIVLPRFDRRDLAPRRTLRKRSAEYSTETERHSLGEMCVPKDFDNSEDNLSNAFCIYFLSGKNGENFLLNLTRFSESQKFTEPSHSLLPKDSLDGYQLRPLVQYMESNSTVLFRNWTLSDDCLFHGYVHRLDSNSLPRRTIPSGFSAVLNLCRGMVGLVFIAVELVPCTLSPLLHV